MSSTLKPGNPATGSLAETDYPDSLDTVSFISDITPPEDGCTHQHPDNYRGGESQSEYFTHFSNPSRPSSAFSGYEFAPAMDGNIHTGPSLTGSPPSTFSMLDSPRTLDQAERNAAESCSSNGSASQAIRSSPRMTPDVPEGQASVHSYDQPMESSHTIPQQDNYTYFAPSHPPSTNCFPSYNYFGPNVHALQDGQYHTDHNFPPNSHIHPNSYSPLECHPLLNDQFPSNSDVPRNSHLSASPCFQPTAGNLANADIPGNNWMLPKEHIPSNNHSVHMNWELKPIGQITDDIAGLRIFIQNNVVDPSPYDPLHKELVALLQLLVSKTRVYQMQQEQLGEERHAAPWRNSANGNDRAMKS